MKHAYLILAHHEFELLQKLVFAIDDSRNDIFIHFDKKVDNVPLLKVENATIYYVEDRLDVSWGDVTVVEAEYALFESAMKIGHYSYYHLLSGVDMPIKSQDFIHDFFSRNKGKEFIGFSNYDYRPEVDRKVNRYHLFPKDFRNQMSVLGIIKKVLRAFLLRMQYILGKRRNESIEFKKGTQWVSLTNDFVSYVLSQKELVLRIYQNTFCADEIFIQTLCWNSRFRPNIFDLSNESQGCMRFIQWKNNMLYDFQNDDFEALRKSNHLFARKFNSKNIDVVNKVLNAITVKNNG